MHLRGSWKLIRTWSAASATALCGMFAMAVAVPGASGVRMDWTVADRVDFVARQTSSTRPCWGASE